MSGHAYDERWLLLPRPRPRPRLRLICFPYAGGNPDLFRGWVDDLDQDVELLAVRLPGRGCRIKEAPYEDWPALIEGCLEALAPYLDSPHAFYGHSFGGRLAYELAQNTRHSHPGATRRLFVSGCRSPASPQAQPHLHTLCAEDFQQALRSMGGTPPAVLESEMLMRLMLPALRSDMRLSEIWQDWHPLPLDIPIHAYFGHDDPIDRQDSMAGWSKHTTDDFELVGIDGGHFFLDSHRRHLLDSMSTRMRHEHAHA
ncbi:thioesterase II family protein [Pseudomonas paraeruginosa]|uniref:thioesterase II family protein n=1 Tax=Pseudomonas paraeruginosa TaxID=2994495 RepID=UPI0039FDA139|nr:thioesterase domain-containing protein [Pseudomonas aeruginosa]HCF2410878.1 thioesterase [Pseudomonas aeruginosa]